MMYIFYKEFIKYILSEKSLRKISHNPKKNLENYRFIFYSLRDFSEIIFIIIFSYHIIFFLMVYGNKNKYYKQKVRHPLN